MKIIIKPNKTEYIYQEKLDLIECSKERKRFETIKDKAHFYFDKLWENNIFSREDAYIWLADRLGITEKEAHFKIMNECLCKDAIYYCMQLLNDMRRLDLDFGAKAKTPFYVIK